MFVKCGRGVWRRGVEEVVEERCGRGGGGEVWRRGVKEVTHLQQYTLAEGL